MYKTFRNITFTILFLIVSALLCWFNFPFWAHGAANYFLKGQGLFVSELTVARPGIHQIHVSEITSTYRGITITAQELRLKYKFTWNKIEITDLTVENVKVNTSIVESETNLLRQKNNDPFNPKDFWTLLPIDKVDITSLEIPGLGYGKISVNNDTAYTNFTFTKYDLNTNFSLSRRNHIVGTVSTRGFTAALKGQLNKSHCDLEIEAEIDLDSLNWLKSSVVGFIDINGSIEVPLIDDPSFWRHSGLKLDYVAKLVDRNLSKVDLKGSLRRKTEAGADIFVTGKTLKTIQKSPVALDLISFELQYPPNALSGAESIKMKADGLISLTDLTINPLPISIISESRFAQRDQISTFVNTKINALNIPIHANTDLTNFTTKISVATSIPLTELLSAAIPLYPEIEYFEPRASGQATISISSEFGESFKLLAGVNFSETSLEFDNILFAGISGDIEAVVTDVITIEPVTLKIRKIDIGLPITDLKTTLNYNNGTINTAQITGSILGGKFTIPKTTYYNNKLMSPINLTLENVRLGQLLSTYNNQISASGKLDGYFPIKLDGLKISMSGGKVSAQKPGGRIQLPSVSGLESKTVKGLNLAMVALEDYRYDTLNAEADYETDGTLFLSVALEGHNPAIENGRKIRYNLNITENLPVLIRSLQLSDSVSNQIEKRMQK